MTAEASPFIYLPGSGGGVPDLSLLGAPFEFVSYPPWQRYVSGSFSAEILVQELAKEISSKVPHGPIKLVGLSIGGHFGYATALRLQTMGREVGGLCVIDSFVVNTAEPTAGWKGRAVTEAFELLRHGQIYKFMEFARSRFWRAMLRLAGKRLPNMLRMMPWLPAIDSILVRELTMRLFTRETVPWLAALDDNPVPLAVPTTLLRTRSTAGDDAAWRRRCPMTQILEITGHHYSLFDPENIGRLRDAFLAGTREWFDVPVHTTSNP